MNEIGASYDQSQKVQRMDNIGVVLSLYHKLLTIRKLSYVTLRSYFSDYRDPRGDFRIHRDSRYFCLDRPCTIRHIPGPLCHFAYL